MKTLYDKIWEKHVIVKGEGDLDLLYIDKHFIHEVTSPQAFEGLRLAGRKLRRPDKTLATMDHNTPTISKDRQNITDPLAQEQLDVLVENCGEFGVRLEDLNSENNGIVHIIWPELGYSLPGETIVCGDSHTATHGAFGAIAFGIGTSEVEHVFATQTLWQKKLKNLGVKLTGKLPHGVYAKDVILALISKYGVSLGTGYCAEFYGDTVENMTMDERMTLCNMAIEGGAKVGLVAPDEKTMNYLKNTPEGPKGKDFDKLAEKASLLFTDSDMAYDKIIELDVTDLKPQISWGTNPSMTVSVNQPFPQVVDESFEKAYQYMGLQPGQNSEDIPISEVFIGSCTNGRYSDLEVAARYVGKNKVAPGVRAVIVPGSMAVKRKAESNGLDRIFIEAGFEWREPGCSSCLGMNPDIIAPYKHCLSTSNRNFEGRQGKNARTHLVSPATAAASAICGKVVDVTKVGQYPLGGQSEEF